MRELIEALCDDACAGRATGTPGGRRARALVLTALRGAGLDPVEQAVAACNGANLVATLEGDLNRYVLVAAHYDHLGTSRGSIFRGADDNAAAVAILVQVAQNLTAARPTGRGVVFAAFDAEEPPHFMNDSMGSLHFARHPLVPLDRIDQMICMDLVGHTLGPAHSPSAVRDSLFVLGAERSQGTAALVDSLTEAVPGVIPRRLDAEIIPPLSDYLPFWQAERPFLFLTVGRSRYYHTPEDTPEKLDPARLQATASWLERLVRASCARDDRAAFTNHGNDAATLSSVIALCDSLVEISPDAVFGAKMARTLLARCDAEGRLPAGRRQEVQMLVAGLERRLA